jgi:hypothetical protein
MRKILLLPIAILITFSLPACKKSSTTSNARTVQNLSGSYNLTSLIWTANGISVNLFDSLPPCEQDNILRLDADGTAHTIDVKILCSPPSPDSVGIWSLSANGDSLVLNNQELFIKSWDGKTLVYTGIVDNGPPPVTGTVTLVKQ